MPATSSLRALSSGGDASDDSSSSSGSDDSSDSDSDLELLGGDSDSDDEEEEGQWTQYREVGEGQKDEDADDTHALIPESRYRLPEGVRKAAYKALAGDADEHGEDGEEGEGGPLALGEHGEDSQYVPMAPRHLTRRCSACGGSCCANHGLALRYKSSSLRMPKTRCLHTELLVYTTSVRSSWPLTVAT